MTDTSRPRFRVSTETRAIYDKIVKMSVGEIVTYLELSKLIGDDIRANGRAPLNSARRMAQRDNQIVLDVVPKVGIKRMSDIDVVGSANATLGVVRRAARRGINRITAVSDFERLPVEMKIKHNAAVSALGVIAAMSRPKEVRKIEAAVNTSQTGQLPVGRVLEMFRRPIPVESDERNSA